MRTHLVATILLGISSLLASSCGRIGYGIREQDSSFDASVEDLPTAIDEGVELGVDAGMDMGAADMLALDLGEDLFELDLGVDLGPPALPDVIVAPTSALSTSESGTTDTFTVRLGSMPTADVQIALVSSDETECTIAPGTLTFTSLNWAAPQTITVTGVDDVAADGDQSFTISTSPAVSADPAYSGFDGPDASGTNRDDETPGIFVTPTAGLMTSEAGGTDMFSVVLNNAPASDVTIDLASSLPLEGNPMPTSLTFTPLNWSAPQFVTVTGADDFVADGNQSYVVVTSASVSTDLAYNGINPADVTVLNLDDETPALMVSPTSGLMTNEAGTIDTFGVRLATQPTSDVVLDIASTDTTEGTISPTSLTFTSANWNTIQNVTVSGVDDVIIDGSQVYVVSVTPNVVSDASYASLAPIDVSVTNADDETAGVTVTPASGLEVSEMGDTATFVVTLNSQPSASVLIPLTSTDTSEGTVSPGTVMFSPATWNTPRMVTITGINDALSDGNQAFFITTGAVVSGDSNYAAIDPPDVSVTNIDDDSPSIIVTPLTVSTSESGATSAFSVRLGSMPTATVTIPILSSDLTEAMVSAASLTFNSFNYTTPQFVTVTPVDDLIADGTQPYTIDLGLPTSTDATYAAINPSNVSGTNTDDETAGVIVSTTSGLTTSETGTTTSFSVRLTSVPASTATVSVSSSDLTEGTVSPAILSFTPMNGTNPITVTVTGVDDALADGAQPFTVVLGPIASAEGAYSGMDPTDVSVTNLDNDTPSLVVTPTSVVTGESGAPATFSISLTAGPSSDVVVGITSSNLAEATVSPATLTFTPVDYAMPHVVTVTGVQDAIIDGAQSYVVLTSAASSVDPAYNGLNAADVTGINNDDDYIVTNAAVSTAGVQATMDTGMGDSGVSISYNGRYVAFRSAASNLVAGDTNANTDIFVRDMMTGVTERVSVGTDGSEATYGASQVISADGRYVAFAASGGASWSGFGAFVRDRVMNTTTMFSLTYLGGSAGGVTFCDISPDARFGVFTNVSGGIVAGDTNGRYDIFVRDILTATTTRQSVISGGGQYTTGAIFAAHSYGTRISTDGRYLVFMAQSGTDLFTTAPQALDNVVLRDSVANTTVPINFDTTGTLARAQALDMTPDGRYIVIKAMANNFAVGDTNGQNDIAVYDRLMGTTTIESVSNTGAQSNQYSDEAAISDDGRYVVFRSAASNLVSGDTNGQADVFVRDRLNHTTRRQSVSNTGAQANAASYAVNISGDGQWVVFVTDATNLFAGDTNAHADVIYVPRL